MNEHRVLDLTVAVYDAFQFCDQRRNIFGDDLPKYVKVHFVVTVNQSIPQPYDPRPLNAGIPMMGRLSDSRCRFSDDLQKTNE